ncbi:hypothetical protein CWATWH0005_5590 [Crocosphaera watsonii WH 0005]|uniref:Uncharacterized protein n=1 Tax=Crocosphaera watsonii WH 0005 TaxID=423472 RepID=T2IY97_CROWT|nr:hypothetical protein CWATWH0005_5590 [Crocosphaera watsonii WH 0005]
MKLRSLPNVAFGDPKIGMVKRLKREELEHKILFVKSSQIGSISLHN